jgi:hypothetical protein
MRVPERAPASIDARVATAISRRDSSSELVASEKIRTQPRAAHWTQLPRTYAWATTATTPSPSLDEIPGAAKRGSVSVKSRRLRDVTSGASK